MRRLTRLPTKPERIMAIAFIMVLCLLVYKLAELRVRQRLAATGQTVPDQVRKLILASDHALALSVRSAASISITPCSPTEHGRRRSYA